jgi:holo-[acyl-carrier protein] synthase
VIAGIGVDLVDLARFEKQLENTPALRDRLFHEAERDNSVRQLAGSFAAKEALVKALGSPVGLSWTELRVWRNELGQPILIAQGDSAARLESLGVDKLHLSISHDGGMLIAYVIAEKTYREGGEDARAAD